MLRLLLSLAAVATAAAHEIKAARVPGMRIDVGVVGSGDAWRQSVKVIREVHERTHSLCEEMEAHAVAQVAARFGVPFIAIKDIANSELEPEAIQLEPSHHIVPDTCKVGYHAALVTDATVRKLAGLLDRGEWVHMFPEGSTNTDPTTLKQFKRGVGHTVLDCVRPPTIIPFYHHGAQNVMPPPSDPDVMYVAPSGGHHIHILFGEPIAIDDLLPTKPRRLLSDAERDAVAEAIANRMHSAVDALRVEMLATLAIEQVEAARVAGE
jgi:hypothetical protein